MSFKKRQKNATFDNVKTDDLSTLEQMLENGTISVDDRNDEGQTYLIQACESGSIDVVQHILSLNVDVNASDKDGYTALITAAKEGYLEVVSELLDKNANIESRDVCNWTSLMWACYRGHLPIVQILLDRGANVNTKADLNVTCLIWAAGRGLTDICSVLIDRGAKVNIPDKFGSTPLLWAARKGYQQIVDLLIAEGANADTVGMNSLTALLIATEGGFTSIVHSLMKCHLNINVTNKDGMTALMIASKDCNEEIVSELLNHGAYVNMCDKVGDSVLIQAVKAGHVNLVKTFLSWFADIDHQGLDGKTAIYWAVEKKFNEVLAVLLTNDANVEILTTKGDSVLMRAVRSKNVESVQMLLRAGAKVSVADKRGDTALHIAVRARSKRITQLLLQNPKNRPLLYRHNLRHETPYIIDAHLPKGILSQIFGYQNLNADDSKNLLGNDIYSSSLADILSAPSLVTPLTIGLFSKWGSGKSLLISKLKDEMKLFVEDTRKINFSPTVIHFFVCLAVNFIISFILGLVNKSWKIPLGLGLGLFALEYAFLSAVWLGSVQYEVQFLIKVSEHLIAFTRRLTLLLKVVFCNPQSIYACTFPNVRFLFSHFTRLTNVGSERSLVDMMVSLSDSLESSYGVVITRIFRVLKITKGATNSGKYKTLFYVPYFVIVLITFALLAVGVSLIVVHGTAKATVNGVMIAILCVVIVIVVGHGFTLGHLIISVFTSHKLLIRRSIKKADSVKLAGLMQLLKQEVDLIDEFVSTINCFLGESTRLVLIVDGLDTCEPSKIFHVLDAIKTLFTNDGSPFITILAVDPHIVIQNMENNMKSGSKINGYDYLRSIIHLPFFLQSLAANSFAENKLKNLSKSNGAGDSTKVLFQSKRQSVSIADSKGKNIAKSQLLHSSSFDLFKSLLKEDLIVDINPCDVRRFKNILAITGRILQGYNIDFVWDRLAAWVNVTECWPYRLSWIIVCWEDSPKVTESTTLLSLYDEFENRFPANHDAYPLLEIDRDVRKLRTFLSSHSVSLLNVGDLIKFLPFSINLDPNLRKFVRESQRLIASAKSQQEQTSFNRFYPTNLLPHFSPPLYGHPYPNTAMFNSLTPINSNNVSGLDYLRPSASHVCEISRSDHVKFQKIQEIGVLSHMTLENICDSLSRLDGISKDCIPEYCRIIVSNNVSGLALFHCDLDELKAVMQMRFGDWQIFRAMVLFLRKVEIFNNTKLTAEEKFDNSNVYRQFDVANQKSVHLLYGSRESLSTSLTVQSRGHDAVCGPEYIQPQLGPLSHGQITHAEVHTDNHLTNRSSDTNQSELNFGNHECLLNMGSSYSCQVDGSSHTCQVNNSRRVDSAIDLVITENEVISEMLKEFTPVNDKEDEDTWCEGPCDV